MQDVIELSARYPDNSSWDSNTTGNSTDDGSDGTTGGDDSDAGSDDTGSDDTGSDDAGSDDTGSDDTGASTGSSGSSNSTSTSDSSSDSGYTNNPTFGKNCPPASAPNDGMYRPGCPGYGRRDVIAHAKRAALGKRDLGSTQLSNLLPALSTLLEAMPDLIAAAGGADVDNNTVSDSSNSTIVANATALASSSSFKKVVQQINSLVDAVNGTSSDVSTATSSSTATAAASTSTSKHSSNVASAAAAAVNRVQSSTSDVSEKEKASAATISHGSQLNALLSGDGVNVARSNGAESSHNGDLKKVSALFSELLSGKKSTAGVKKVTKSSKKDD